MERITNWDRFKNMINGVEVGSTIDRYDLISIVKYYTGSKGTIDYFRNISEKTGYLSKTKRSGRFIVEKHFNKFDTLSKIRYEYDNIQALRSLNNTNQ